MKNITTKVIFLNNIRSTISLSSMYDTHHYYYPHPYAATNNFFLILSINWLLMLLNKGTVIELQEPVGLCSSEIVSVSLNFRILYWYILEKLTVLLFYYFFLIFGKEITTLFANHVTMHSDVKSFIMYIRRA